MDTINKKDGIRKKLHSLVWNAIRESNRTIEGAILKESFTNALFHKFLETSDTINVEALRNEEHTRDLVDFEINDIFNYFRDALEDLDIKEAISVNFDIFGEAFEYLERLYATNSGKATGEFYTPRELGCLMTLLSLNDENKEYKVYDPTCGCGALLTSAKKVLDKNKIQATYYGQEINKRSHKICRMNMLLHGVAPNKIGIALGDTLLEPKHTEKFNLIIGNPPYSVKWDGKKNPKLLEDERFKPAKVLAPSSKGDLAFVMHALHHLEENGTASVVCFPGVLYRGGAEKEIRKYLVDNNYIDTIISMPPNIFLNTQIATVVMVLKKNKKDNNIMFINATKEYITQDKLNVITDESIKKIVESFRERKDIEDFARLVSYEELKKEDFGLSVSRYVDIKEKKEKIDIIKLNREIRELHESNFKKMMELDRCIEELEEMFNLKE